MGQIRDLMSRLVSRNRGAVGWSVSVFNRYASQCQPTISFLDGVSGKEPSTQSEVHVWWLASVAHKMRDIFQFRRLHEAVKADFPPSSQFVTSSSQLAGLLHKIWRSGLNHP